MVVRTEVAVSDLLKGQQVEGAWGVRLPDTCCYLGFGGAWETLEVGQRLLRSLDAFSLLALRPIGEFLRFECLHFSFWSPG
jgi:hypothetical protein